MGACAIRCHMHMLDEMVSNIFPLKNKNQIHRPSPLRECMQVSLQRYFAFSRIWIKCTILCYLLRYYDYFTAIQLSNCSITMLYIFVWIINLITVNINIIFNTSFVWKKKYCLSLKKNEKHGLYDIFNRYDLINIQTNWN